MENIKFGMKDTKFGMDDSKISNGHSIYNLEKADTASETSSEENTITSQQLKIVKKYAKICGFKGLMDYQTKVTAKNITDDVILSLNKLAVEINELFPIHEINLKRTNFKFTSSTLVMSVLRGLLTYVGIRWRSTRTKSSIHISLVPDEECDYDKSVATHAEFINKCVDCKPIIFEVLGKDNVIMPTKNTYGLLLESKRYPWMKDNVKKLKIIDIPTNIIGLNYFLIMGNDIIYSGKLNGKNIYPVKYIPFRLVMFNNISMYIHFDLVDPSSLKLKFEYTPFMCDNFHKYFESMMTIPWSYPNNILRFFSGMMGPSHSCIVADIEKTYAKCARTSNGKKILDTSINKNMGLFGNFASSCNFPNGYHINCDDSHWKTASSAFRTWDISKKFDYVRFFFEFSVGDKTSYEIDSIIEFARMWPIYSEMSEFRLIDQEITNSKNNSNAKLSLITYEQNEKNEQTENSIECKNGDIFGISDLFKMSQNFGSVENCGFIGSMQTRVNKISLLVENLKKNKLYTVSILYKITK